MAQKRKPTTRKKTSTKRKSIPSKKGGSSFGKFVLGILILVALAYGVLAFQEGKLVPSIISEFELNVPELSEEDPEPKMPTTKEPTKTRTKSTKSNTIENPEVNLEGFDLYFTKAFDFMWPDYETDQAIIERPYYTLRYSEEHEQAVWVAFHLYADSLKQSKVSFSEDYRKDPRVRTTSAEPRDYRSSGHLMGQLAPVDYFSYDKFAASQSFYLSNVSPQKSGFKNGIWKDLQDRVKEWALQNDEIFIVTGPVLRKNLPSIGANAISIPEYFYQIVLDIQKPEIKAVAFLLKNDGNHQSLRSSRVSIDEIEQLTGLDFFPTISDDLEKILESTVDQKGWF